MLGMPPSGRGGYVRNYVLDYFGLADVVLRAIANQNSGSRISRALIKRS
jgi:hypothetical protein